MYQQHGISWPGLLRGPRVGIGALALGMAAAFVAGGIVVSLVAGSYVTIPPAAITTGTQNDTLAEDSREAGGTSSSGPAALTRELLLDDFVPVPAARSRQALTRELLVDDFLPVPAPRSEPALTRELLVDDFVPVPGD